MWSSILWSGTFGFLVSLGVVAAARNSARRRALLDRPNERSLHIHPTPRGGGIGVVVPVLACLIALSAANHPERASIGWIAAVGAGVAVVGLLDDLRSLPALARLLAQVAAAVAIAAALGHWRLLEWPGVVTFSLGWLGLPLTIILVVGLTNAYNFMDGIDGIAGTQGVIAGLGWVGVGLTIEDPTLAMIGAVLGAANVGFLVFNWPPASIFMGDVGSSFLGFILAALVVLVAPRAPEIALAGVLFVWPFVLDTTFTFLRRASRGENVLSAHRTHLYQRLVLRGVPHRTTALLYGALAIVGVATGHTVMRKATAASVAGAFAICLLSVGLWLTVVWYERYRRRPGD